MEHLKRWILATMSEPVETPDQRFRRIMTEAAHRILAGTKSPYEIGIELLGDLAGPELLDKSDFAGAAYMMWGSLTDGIDGPPRYAQGRSESEILDLMRLAAREWLDLEPTPENVHAYLLRWEDWPLLGPPPD